MKYYCLTCGKPTSYSLNLPKFCSECGTPTVNGEFKTPNQDFYNKLKQQNTILPQNETKNFQNGDNTDFTRSHRPPADPHPEKPRIIPVDKMAMAEFTKDLEPANERVRQFQAKIEFDRAPTRPQEVQDEYNEIESSEDIDSEYFDTSKFKNVRPKFKIQTFGASKDSLESLVTQGYMMNAKPEAISHDRGPAPSQEQVLAEFQREAGASRQK